MSICLLKSVSRFRSWFFEDNNSSYLVEIPYEPPFDFEIPDYKKLGGMLFQVVKLDPKSVLGEFTTSFEPCEAPQVEPIERLYSYSGGYQP